MGNIVIAVFLQLITQGNCDKVKGGPIIYNTLYSFHRLLDKTMQHENAKKDTTSDFTVMLWYQPHDG